MYKPPKKSERFTRLQQYALEHAMENFFLGYDNTKDWYEEYCLLEKNAYFYPLTHYFSVREPFEQWDAKTILEHVEEQFDNRQTEYMKLLTDIVHAINIEYKNINYDEIVQIYNAKQKLDKPII